MPRIFGKRISPVGRFESSSVFHPCRSVAQLHRYGWAERSAVEGSHREGV